MSKKVNWGILGCASIAKNRTIPGFLMADNANLVAIASRGIGKASAYAGEFGIKKAYDSYDKLLADDEIEAVYTPLPNAVHREWVEKAAKAGKHVLCEKPMGLNEEEEAEMFAVCEEQGVLLMEGFAYRHAPLIQKVKEIMDSGMIGQIKYIESHLTDLLTDMTNIRMNQNLGGGAFYDMACYNISTISYLMDLAEPVQVKALAERNSEYGVDVSNTILLQYENGVQAMSYSSLNSYPRGYYAVVGDKGRIEVPCNYNCRNVQKFTVAVKGSVSNVEILDEETTEYTVMCPNNYMMEIEQFGRCITDGEKPLVSKEESLLNARILHRAIESAG